MKRFFATRALNLYYFWSFVNNFIFSKIIPVGDNRKLAEENASTTTAFL